MEKILTEIRSKYLNISKRQLNQYPFHMKKMATLELVSTERTNSTEHSKDTDKSDEVSVSHQIRVDYNNCDLFKRPSESEKVVILIEGEAGTGKTILCTLIIDDWASRRHFKEFFIALLLPLDQINNSMASISSIADLFSLLYDFDDDTSSCLVKHLRKHPSKILLIIDGWDQCPEARYQEGSFLNSLIFGNPFEIPRDSSVTMVIASRPGCRSPQFDQHISVKGFSSETVHSCVASEVCGDRKIECFSEQLENNPLVEKMCSVPLNLAIFLKIFQSSESFPVTTTGLYTKVVWCLAQLSIKNSGIHKYTDELSCYDDLPGELQQSWWLLCELAFKSIHAAFSESEVSNYLSSELKAISYFGTIKPNFVCERQGGFALYFLHPVIEEYLAAQHLARQQLTSLHLDECAPISHLSECFWKFFLSIYVNDTLMPHKLKVGIISHTIQLVSKRHYCSDSGSLILCQYSFEAKHRIVDQKITEALCAQFSSSALGSDSPMLCFSCPQNAYNCMSVMYMIKSIEHKCSMKINFRNCGIAEAQTLELGKIIGSKKGKIQVKDLDLSENGLSDSVVVDFVDHAAAALQSLEKLFLCNCGIGERSVRAFLELLAKTSPTLMLLDLSFNPFSAHLLQIVKDHIIVKDTLMKLEILSLKGSLPTDINMHQLGDLSKALVTHCSSFRQLDLSANTLGKPGNADLKQIISEFINHRRRLDLFLKDEYMSEVDKKFTSVMEDSIRTKGTIDHTIAHGVFVGPGRAGKDTLMKRLMGAGPPDADCISPSTGVLENIIKMEVKKMSTVAAAVSNLKWQRLKYDEEALELMMTTAKYHTVSSSISKPISTKCIVKDRLSRIESPTLPTDTSNQNPVMNKCDSKVSISENNSINSDDGNQEASSTRNVTVYSSDIAPVEIFKKALKCRRMDALREHLESSWSLYLTNTGGQIEFQELLPILVCGPSVFFITFPLHHDLQMPYSVQYQHSNVNLKVKSYQSASTLIEELLQILATICALDCSKDQRNVKCVPKVFFIGTHKDCLTACTAEKTIDRIDKQLQMHVNSTVLSDQSSIQYSQPHRMIFTVNNLSKHDQDFQRIRLAVQQTIERKKEFTVTCPSSWLVFSLILRAKHKSIQALHFDDCFNIAHECGISDRKELSAALSFIHSRLGLVRYFKSPDSELNQYVIVDPQILFDTITHLIVKTFNSDHAEGNEIRDFYQRGIFPEEVVQRISEKCGSDLRLPSTWLTKLLNFIRIAALFIDRDNKKKYFFPAALCHPPETYLQHDNDPETCLQRTPSSVNSPQPWLVGFEGGFCPRGIPGALIKYLTTNEMQSKHHWKLLSNKLFMRNQVSFRIGAWGYITLKIFPTHLEIYVDTDKGSTDDDFMEICKL